MDDLKHDIDVLTRFQGIARQFIDVIGSRMDNAWQEISNGDVFDAEKLREHVEFSGLFMRFRESFELLEDIGDTLDYYHDGT